MKPQVCKDYKRIMPGVDKMDQMMSAYDPTRKRLKRYYRRIYLTLLEMAFYNSFVVYNQLVGEDDKVTYLKYKMMVIKKMVAKYGKSINRPRLAAAQRGNVVTSLRLQPGNHLPIEIGKNNKGNKKYLNCWFCRDQEEKSEKLENMKGLPRSNIMCSSCNAILCITPCFYLYHTEMNYATYYKRLNVSNLH